MLIESKKENSKYNPYEMLYINDRYIIQFKDIGNKIHKVEVKEKIFEEFNKFRLKDKSQMNEFDRHIEHSNLSEHTLNRRMIKEKLNTEDEAIKNIQYKKLHKAILKLPSKQRKTIIMYFFNGLSQKQIAQKENCSIRAIQYSLRIGLKNLKKYLNETS